MAHPHYASHHNMNNTRPVPAGAARHLHPFHRKLWLIENMTPFVKFGIRKASVRVCARVLEGAWGRLARHTRTMENLQCALFPSHIYIHIHIKHNNHSVWLALWIPWTTMRMCMCGRIVGGRGSCREMASAVAGFIGRQELCLQFEKATVYIIQEGFSFRCAQTKSTHTHTSVIDVHIYMYIYIYTWKWFFPQRLTGWKYTPASLGCLCTCVRVDWCADSPTNSRRSFRRNRNPYITFHSFPHFITFALLRFTLESRLHIRRIHILKHTHILHIYIERRKRNTVVAARLSGSGALPCLSSPPDWLCDDVVAHPFERGWCIGLWRNHIYHASIGQTDTQVFSSIPSPYVYIYVLVYADDFNDATTMIYDTWNGRLDWIGQSADSAQCCYAISAPP